MIAWRSTMAWRAQYLGPGAAAGMSSEKNLVAWIQV